MAYFVIEINIRIVAPDVSVPTQLESLDLDFLQEVMIFLVCVPVARPFWAAWG